MNNQRLSELDLLRGVALLGIFLMNIVAMAYPLEAYVNPFAFDAKAWRLHESIDVSAWRFDDTIFSALFIFVDQKMMAMFSLLFGVGTVIFLDKAQQKGLKRYFIRNIWLIVFGCLHAVFLFFGDILLVYGVCALLLWMFASLRAWWLIILGCLCFYAPMGLFFNMQMALSDFSAEQLLELHNLWQPSAEAIRAQIESVHILSYEDFVLTNLGILDESQVGSVWAWYTSIILVDGVARSFGMMLVGMGLYKSGFLPNLRGEGVQLSSSSYRQIAVFFLSVGVLLSAIGLYLNYAHQWAANFSTIQGRLLLTLATPLMAIAYLSLILLWARGNVCEWLQQAIKAVGQMALSNYIAQSVVGLMLFTGVGFALFGELERWQLLLVVVCVWLCHLIFSTLWLRQFRFGPLEWCWRCLTYFQWVPMRQRRD